MRNFLCMLFVLSFFFGIKAQVILPYKNPSLPVEVRVADLLKRMTPEEKFRQLFMIAHDGPFDSEKYQHGIFGLEMNASMIGESGKEQMMNYTNVTSKMNRINEMNRIQGYLVNHTRLGIPAIFFGEALHGVVGADDVAFPQSIALAASFDTSLMRRVATAIAKDALQLGMRQVLSPVINIASDVRWGRVEETYGEDPFLTSEMTVAFVKAFESRGIITTPKHFVANVGDGGRDSYPIHMDQNYMEAVFLEPFKQAIQRGGARSIMSSYNSVNGKACSMNSELLNHLLKKEWGFKGFVISDAGAVGGANVLHNTSVNYPMSGKVAIENGLDVIFQTSISHDTLFNPYFLKGAVNPIAIDAAVARVLRAKFELGLFEHPFVSVPSVESKQAEQALALEAAIKSAVLLKNKNKVLPFPKNNQSIAVIGQDAVECRLGGYSGSGYQKISYLDGLKNRFPNERIQYEEGVKRNPKNFQLIASQYLKCGANQKGLLVKYYDNIELKGEPVRSKIEDQLDFHYTFYGPEAVQREHFSLSCEGYIHIPETGIYKIGLEGNDGYQFIVDNKLLIDRWDKVSFHQDFVSLRLNKDDSIKVNIRFKESAGNAQLKLFWDYQCIKDETNAMQEALTLAARSDRIIYCAGIEEGEFNDRSHLSLSGRQEEMILRLSRLRKPLIVVLTGGSAIRMDKWIDSVDAVLEMWYPGEQGGNALAKLVSGDAAPTGRLPISFPMNEGQLPLSYLHEPTGRGDDYTDGTGLPLFPFGYGLSYTSFNYSELKVSESDSTILVSFVLSNTGEKCLATPQVYLSLLDEPSSNGTVHPVLQLAAFSKVELENASNQVVRMLINKNTFFKGVSTESKIHYKLFVGNSSRDLQLVYDKKY